MRDRLLVLLTLTLLGAVVAEAQLPRAVIKELYSPTKSKTELRVAPLLDQLPSSGYTTVRVSIVNDGKIHRTWNFEFNSSDANYTNEGNELRSTYTVSCQPKKSTEVDLLVPLVTAFQAGFSTTTTLTINVKAPTPLRGSSATLLTTYDPRFPAVMVSEDLYNRNGSNLASAVEVALSGGPHGGGFGSSGIEFGAAFNPRQMPDDWRAYSGYDACLLTEDDWGLLPPGARIALLKWNRLGGNLVIYSSNSTTTLSSLNIDQESRGRREATLGWGSVTIQPLPAGGLLDADPTVKLVMDEIPKKTGTNRLQTLRDGFRPHWPLQTAFGSKTAHIVFFILILIAFGILVGPVNLFVFARAGQRHRLFITTPIISFSASLLLVVLILFQDGFGGRGQRVILMELGPDHTAYLSQEQIARTGVLLNTGFTTNEHGYLSPIMIAESRWARVTQGGDGGRGRYTVDLREDGLKAAGDWFQSRSEHGHLFETVRPTRGRVTLVRGGNDPVINSTFEFPLETLYYLDSDGNSWTAAAVQQGRNTTLQATTTRRFDEWIKLESFRFAPRNRMRIDLAAGRRGHFFAVSREGPGVDTLRSINWSDTYTFLTGAVATP